MKAHMSIVLLAGVALAAAGLGGGCSGTGAPAEPRELASLRALAKDQVTAILLMKQWFPLLYPPPSPPTVEQPCKFSFGTVDSEPNDPPGSTRYYILLSDCTEISAVQRADGSGYQTAQRPDGMERYMTWTPLHIVDPWWTQSITQSFWDGTAMDYELGTDTSSALWDQYYRGSLKRAGGEQMQFDWERNLERDLLALDVGGGATLEVKVPLGETTRDLHWPLFEQPAECVVRGTLGSDVSIQLSGTLEAEWEQCRTQAVDGTVGMFSLGPGLAGSGRFEKGGTTIAAFRWDTDGTGHLEPVMLPALDVAPLSAARRLAIDQWIRRVAELGPLPAY